MNLIIVFCAICFVFKIPVDAWNISLYLYKNLKREWAFFQYIFWWHSLVIGYPLFLGQDILPHWHCSFLCFNTLLQMNRHPWVFSLYQKSLHRFCLDVMRVCNQLASVGMIQNFCQFFCDLSWICSWYYQSTIINVYKLFAFYAYRHIIDITQK